MLRITLGEGAQDESHSIYSISLVSLSVFERVIGGETFPATKDYSCSIEGSADPRTDERQSNRQPPTPDRPSDSQYGVKRLYPPLYKPACRQKRYARCEGPHMKQQGFQHTPDVFELTTVPTPYVVVGPTEWW